MSNKYDKLSEERKKLQSEGLMPDHWSTGSWQLFKEKYLYEAENPREQYERIASTLSVHTKDPGFWKEKFFDIMWSGWLSPSTPVLSNTGTKRGLPVSCSGTYISDSIDSIYKAKHEVAMLTKMGFGTASYLGDIRPRGADISVGGRSSGVMPIIQGMQKDMEYVSQGTARRGSWAGYLPIEHGDFNEVCTYLEQHPDGNNIGWNISNQFIERLKSGDTEAIHRYGKALKTKLTSGKGYFFFNDKAQDKRPKWYKDKNLDVKSSQLCSEIMLHSSNDYTYTCVLSSMNVFKYDEWKDTDAVETAIVFLDCVCQEFIEQAKDTPGLEKAVEFTRKSRALGLGQCGFHSYLLEHGIAWGTLESYTINNEISKLIYERAIKASEWLASIWGEPEWMRGYGRANSHLIAIAPTKSSSLLVGGVSEGINPDTAFVYTQRSAGGEIARVNPILLEIMKRKGVYNKTNVNDINEHMGSVQHVDWLTQDEKLVWRTAFEIDQHDVINMASARADYLDQWQSLNLFFSAQEDESYVNSVHKQAFLDPNILALYYIYSMAGISVKRDDECLACS